MQRSGKCTFLAGESTDKGTMDKLEAAMDNHSIEQFEFLFYKKNRKYDFKFARHLPTPSLTIIPHPPSPSFETMNKF